MLGSSASNRPAPDDSWDDPLAYLRRSSAAAYRRNQILYHAGQTAPGLYLVTQGKVAVSRHTVEGRRILVDIYKPDEFFGESALIDPERRADEAIAFEDVRAMFWPANDLFENMLVEPRLGVSLLRVAVRRGMELTQRIESLALEPIGRRLARALIRFSNRLGIAGDGGIVRVPALTHDMLGQYIGTSREIVTQHMNQFRRQGWVRYSRACLQVNRQRLQEFLSAGDAAGMPHGGSRPALGWLPGAGANPGSGRGTGPAR